MELTDSIKTWEPANGAHWNDLLTEDVNSLRSGAVEIVHQSLGGSSKQARAPVDDLEADVVTMNQPFLSTCIARAGKSWSPNIICDHRTRRSWQNIQMNFGS